MTDGKTVIHSFIAHVNAHDFVGAAGLLTEDCVHHTVGLGHGRRVGREAWHSLMESLWAAFPDRCVRMHEVIAEAERVALRLTWTGTHLGEFAGRAATGRTVEVNGICVFSVRDGRIVEQWMEHDMLSLYQQLGMAPGRSDNWPST